MPPTSINQLQKKILNILQSPLKTLAQQVTNSIINLNIKCANNESINILKCSKINCVNITLITERKNNILLISAAFDNTSINLGIIHSNNEP